MLHAAIVGPLPAWGAALVWLTLSGIGVLLWRATRAEDARCGHQLNDLVELCEELADRLADLEAHLAPHNYQPRHRRPDDKSTEIVVPGRRTA